MIYATFWQRFAALWLDFACFLPLFWVTFKLNNEYRLFQLWYYLPGLLIGIWYYVVLVKQYGGTPGKLLLKIKIVKTDGSAVGYREAGLRHLVLFLLTAASSLAMVIANSKMSDVDYLSLDWQARALRQVELAPSWNRLVTILMQVWIWSEFIVMLSNKQRRGPHDFMAGTVVIKNPVQVPVSA